MSNRETNHTELPNADAAGPTRQERAASQPESGPGHTFRRCHFDVKMENYRNMFNKMVRFSTNELSDLDYIRFGNEDVWHNESNLLTYRRRLYEAIDAVNAALRSVESALDMLPENEVPKKRLRDMSTAEEELLTPRKKQSRPSQVISLNESEEDNDAEAHGNVFTQVPHAS